MSVPPGMPHPKDRSGLTRGQLLRGAAAAAAGVGVAGGLAACENTTTPIGVGCEPGAEGGSGSPLVEAKPVGPGGLPASAHRQQRHLGDRRRQPADRRWASAPRTGQRCASSTTRTTSGPACCVASRSATTARSRSATYNSADEAIAKLQSGTVPYDVDPRALRHPHRQPDGPAAPAAAQPHLPPEPGGEHLAGARRPLLRPRRRATRCRTSPGRTASAGGTTGSPWTSRSWTSRGTSSGSRSSGEARSGSWTTSATASRCRCSATRWPRGGSPT